MGAGPSLVRGRRWTVRTRGGDEDGRSDNISEMLLAILCPTVDRPPCEVVSVSFWGVQAEGCCLSGPLSTGWHWAGRGLGVETLRGPSGSEIDESRGFKPRGALRSRSSGPALSSGETQWKRLGDSLRPLYG